MNAYTGANPDKKVIRLGIGDVTLPLAPAVIKALHSAVDEMADAATFKGYAPDLGYEFLRSAIVENDYKARGVDIAIDEIFVSDGAKSDSGNIGDIFAKDNKIASCVTRFIRYMWIRMPWQEGQENISRRKNAGRMSFICRVQQTMILCRRFLRRRRI